MQQEPWWMWASFTGFVIIAIIVDIVVLEKKGAHRVSIKEAVTWSVVWVSLALIFNILLWFYFDQHDGRQLANKKAAEFLTGYLIEKSLSVDNIFVFLLLMTRFKVPVEQQKKALIIGVIGAIVLRVIMILIGAWMISRFNWILYFFGLFLLFTGVKMLIATEQEHDPTQHPLLRWMQAHIKISTHFVDGKLWYSENGQTWFTPLFVVIMLIGITDVIFAVDSIPAIFAITTDPFIVMTSNIFAVLGLRALYFLLADMADRFHFLKYGLALVLIFIGIKMLIVHFIHIPVYLSLSFVIFVLVASIVASLVFPKNEPTNQ